MEGQTEKWVIVIGAGGHGSELGSYIQDLRAAGERIRLVGFIDENKAPGPFLGSEILGGFQELKAFLQGDPERSVCYITAVGNNKTRLNLVEKVKGLRSKNFSPWTIRHPSAQVGSRVEIGEGACLAPGAVITTGVRFGRHGILNVHASVSHDCAVGDFVNINPHAVLCGDVRIGDGCFIGAGATVTEKVSIGPWSTIGAGAVVIDDIPPGVTAVGVPARVIG